MPDDRVELAGSVRVPVTGHSVISAVDSSSMATVTIYLRGGPGPDAQSPLSRERYVELYGATESDIDIVRAFALSYDLEVDQVDRSRRSISLSGPLSSLAAAFGTELSMFGDNDSPPYRGRQGSLSLPGEVAPVVTAVLGLDERPQADTGFRVAPEASASYTPVQLAQMYDFPTAGGASGQTVALIELGGGFRSEDISAYFAGLGVAAPSVTALSVDGGANTPGLPSGPDGEVMLDIEVVGGVAPGVAIAVYFAPNTDQGFIDAVSTAAHDTTHRPSVISISWGGAESTWTSQAMQQMEQVFVEATTMGVTVTVACGDNGSTDGQTDGLSHVDFPASAPHALACGGTSLQGTSGRITAETVWNDGVGAGATGGGISDVFALPSYQQSAGVPPSVNPGGRVGRGVPDVAGDADPRTGYSVRVDGQTMVIGGTSAVAPLWAGLLALANAAGAKPVGFVHAALYASSAAFNDITLGTNGAYSARPGWDPCTGLGSPKGAAVLAAVRR